MTAIVITTSTGGIAIDYTIYYDRIATALENIASTATVISNTLQAISTNIQNIAD